MHYITRYYCRLNDTRPTTWSEVTSGSLLARLVSLLGSSINLCNLQMTSLACFYNEKILTLLFSLIFLFPVPLFKFFILNSVFVKNLNHLIIFSSEKFKNFGSEFFFADIETSETIFLRSHPVFIGIGGLSYKIVFQMNYAHSLNSR